MIDLLELLNPRHSEAHGSQRVVLVVKAARWHWREVMCDVDRWVRRTVLMLAGGRKGRESSEGGPRARVWAQAREEDGALVVDVEARQHAVELVDNLLDDAEDPLHLLLGTVYRVIERFDLHEERGAVAKLREKGV